MPSSAIRTAPALLLVHGFPTSSVDWYDVVPALSREHRVCVLDFPGFGFSDKPKGESYTIDRDCDLVRALPDEVLDVRAGSVVAHDRGDSVALTFAARCGSGDDAVRAEPPRAQQREHVPPAVEPHRSSSGLRSIRPPRPRSSPRRRRRSSRREWARTPSLRRAGWRTRPSPPWPTPSRCNDGIAVLHDTIQYLVERSEHEQEWLEALAGSPVPTTLMWGLYDVVSPLRVAAHVWSTYLAEQAGRQRVLASSAREPLPPTRSAPGVRRGRDGRPVGAFSGSSRPALHGAGGADPGGSFAVAAALRQRGAGAVLIETRLSEDRRRVRVSAHGNR